MNTFDRVEEARERNEGFAYEAYHERAEAWRSEREEEEQEQDDPDTDGKENCDDDD